MNPIIRIGNAQAFWGDRPSAARELLSREPGLDFLTMDYLAEVSMSILAVQRDRDPRLGYPRDFVAVVRELADYWAAGGRCRLIVNAGGINPQACAEACRRAIEGRGCRALTIGIVSGDDVLPMLRQHSDEEPAAEEYGNLDSRQPLAAVRDRLVTANAYLGCEGIVRALDAGAEIVITGRVADPSLVVAACAHAFSWKADDWQRLAGATVAGHLLECGTHVSGGICTDWLQVPDPVHIGFPLAEVDHDGGCVITKPAGSGGMVTVETVKEQLVYEIGDPACYLSPDVGVSFLELTVEQIGPNRVRVHGARGFPRPPTLKVSATLRDGFRAAGMLSIVGPDAGLKGRRCGSIVLERLREAGCCFRDAIVECLGDSASVPVSPAVEGGGGREVVLRIAVEAVEQADVEAFSREMVSLVTAGPQGTTGYAEGRPRVHPIYRYWPCLIGRERVTEVVRTLSTADTLAARTEPATWPPVCPTARALRQSERFAAVAPRPSGTLADIAYGRSGDKGTAANIGIVVRDPAHFSWLVGWLTEERVSAFFAPLAPSGVERFLLDNLGGMNFLLRGVLRRGIRNDSQGKALAQALLAIRLPEDAPRAAGRRRNAPRGPLLGSDGGEERPWTDGLSIGQVLRDTARRFPDSEAVVFTASDWRRTWSELDGEVDLVARALLALDFRRGDHCGVWATNVPQWLLLQLATARIGVVLVTVNPSYRASELAHVLRQADLRGLALIDNYKTTDYHAALRDVAPEIAVGTPGDLRVDSFPSLRCVLSLRGTTPAGAIGWEEFLTLAARTLGAELAQAEAEVSCADPINIQFTSGTTGVPKGATLSHHNILTNAFHAGTRQRFSSSDRICIPVPLYHCFGCVLGSLCGVVHGATMIFPGETFQADATLAAIEAERCTAVYGVPTMFIAMLEHPEYPQRHLACLRTGIMAGSPCPIELMKQVTGGMGAEEMTIGYGQTEASPLITQTRFDDPLEIRVGTVGRALPGIEVKVIDPVTGRTLPDGEAGELCARGHGVMLGYYRMPEMTARAIDAEGWLHTGDLGLCDEQNCFRITGRLKELVIRGGENVFPREIEEVLHRHPAVRDVQVIGVPDRKFGEQVMAWVSLREGASAGPEELASFCRERLAYFKVPHYWKFVEAFPTTITGKIQKFRMREISIQELGLESVANIETA